MKKTKIYLIVTILVFLLSIVLVACGDKPSQDTPTEQEKKYTVTFVVDGEDYFTLETSGKSAIELPPNPTKDGYEFVGWYFDVNVWLNPCNSTSFANENLTANVTVYARWELIKETYSVTFVGGTGATGDAPTMEAKAEGDKFDLPKNTFVKEDYDFDGWFDGQTKYAAGDEYVMPSYAVTFTAQWVLTPKFNVAFVGGEGAVGTDPEIEDKKEGEVITLPENPYTKEDYIFAGWSDGEKTYLAAATYTMPKKDVEFVAVWEYSKYIVSFDSRGGSDVEAAKVDKNGKLTAPKQPKRNGYLFSGWYKNEDCTTLWDFDVDKVKGNITLYAKWVVDAVGISSVEGATIDGNNILMVIEKDVEFVELAEKVILANTNAYWNLYYDRLGQTKIPTKIAANQTDGSLDPAENVFYILVTSENGLQEKLYTLTIYRRFTVNVKYYDKDNNLIVDKDDATLTSYQMDTFNTINVAYDKYSAIGYSFDGWDIIVDGERVPFVFGENGTNVLDNVNLYAHVTPLQYVATFTLGDGETLDVTSQTMTYDAQYTLPVPQKTGYTFKGWYYEKSYDYIYLSDGNGASSSVWTVTQDVELKADWSVNYYTVSIETNYDGAGSVYGGGQWAYDRDCTISVQTNLGYTFVGWYDGETLLTTENAYTFKMLTSDRLFAAKWEINEEMQPFEFTSSTTSCTITKLKDMSATEVTIPDYVTGINSSAFKNCYRLIEVYNKSSLIITAGASGNGYVAYYAKNVYTTEGGSKLSTDGNGYVIYTDGTDKILVTYNGSETKLTLPSDITQINQYAFYGCSGLTSVTIPDSVTSIGKSAFSGCSSLESITIPFVGDRAGITSSDDYQYQFGYIFGASSYGGGVATEQRCYGSSMSSVTFRIYYIPSSLKSVTVTGGNILYGAFYNCSRLTSVTIGNGVTSIGDNAFYNCSGLTSITIGSGVTNIGEDAFYKCTGLTSIYYTGDVAGWCEISGLDKLMSSSRTLYIGGNKIEGELIIPDGVTSIGNSAFRGCSGLTSITIPDSVTSIGNSAFSGCSGLTSITIPDSVTRIGESAFYGCSSLESITIPFVGGGYYSYEKVFGYIFGYRESSSTVSGAINQYDNFWYYIPTSLKTVVIGDGATSIPNNAFYNCTELTSVTIPDSVTSIGEDAFNECTGLTSITIGSGVTNIGEDAFYKCTGLTSIYYTGDVAGWCGISGLHKLMSSSRTLYIGGNKIEGELIIPDGVTSIGSFAFSGCTGLTSVTIGNSVTSIGQYAFYGCRGLTSITIPDSVTRIGESAFDGCSSLKSVTIGSGVTSIGKSAFENCSSLTSIIIPDGVKSIGYSAFKNCTGLTSITIPDSVTSIDSFAFSGCTGLTSVTIGNSVTSIGYSAFYCCTGLTSVTIGNSVTSIGEYAFYGCGLTRFDFTGTIEQWNEISKGSGWNYSTGSYKIYCTDGTINK